MALTDAERLQAVALALMRQSVITTSGVELSLVVSVTTGATVTATKGTKSITGTAASGSCTLKIPEAGTWSVSATLSGQTSDVKSVNVVDSYAVAFTFVSSTLNDNNWDVISQVSDDGDGANYWAIGDRKAVTLSGTVGALTLSSFSTYAFIIGFNHNSSYEGSNRIHFQFAKTAQTEGTDVCFTDSIYGTTDGGFRMNTTNSNSGGWASSNMRTALCGTSITSYSGTFIGVLPAALRAALKSVTKYTNNTGNSTAASAVTATTDYIFLLAEYEVFGATTYANSTEASYQAQYAYYSAGNSKIKYQHASTSTAARWWLRSPVASNSYRFVRVYTDGTVNYGNAHYSYGFAPGFCV